MQAPRRGLPTWAFVSLVAVAAVALGAIMGVVGGSLGFLLSRTSPDDLTGRGSAPPTASVGPRAPGSVADIAESALPGVVSIAVDAAAQSGSGSGFVLREDGYVVTNNHVVAGAADGAGSVDVVLADGRRLPATIIGRNVSYDIAVLSVAADGLPVLDVGDSDRVTVGDTVIAIGAPLGLDGTVTVGIVSALDRPVTTGEDEDASFISAIQTDAAINPGNSGGPLLDGAGRVIGVTSAIAALAEERGSIGLGFAIPVNAVQRIAREIIETGSSSTPIMGVTLDTRFEGRGALIDTVTSGGPAERAGLEPGDVVTTLQGRPVANADELVVAIRDNSPGDIITVVVERGGVVRELQVTLGSRPDE
ncbi:MAG: PDZ domain-containing protein [Actinobacteria bacterium]|nr:PDZ domain-containing protein [Actinomycetota bacterium]